VISSVVKIQSVCQWFVFKTVSPAKHAPVTTSQRVRERGRGGEEEGEKERERRRERDRGRERKR
jgi:hypothetical protein